MIKNTFFAILLFSLTLASSAIAQRLPVAESIYVNDFANILSSAAEARIEKQLKSFNAEHGIEFTVVTIDSRSTYSNSVSIEAFATLLFNEWGVGSARKNDGIMALIAHKDREMRLELGRGWAQSYNATAQRVIDRAFLPDFKDDAYEAGIEAGVTETIRRFSPDFSPSQSERLAEWLEQSVIFIFMAFVGLVILPWRKIKDASVHVRKCPNCGARQLRRDIETEREATTDLGGLLRVTTQCSNCSYRDETTRTSSPRSSSGGGGSFGGGSSSGGGASGRW